MEEGLVSTSRRRTRTRTREERMETFRETNPGKPSPIGRVMLTLRGIPHAGKRNGGTLFGRLILRPSLLGCPAGVVMRNAGSIGIPPANTKQASPHLGYPGSIPRMAKRGDIFRRQGSEVAIAGKEFGIPI